MAAEGRTLAEPRLSPDGTRIAFLSTFGGTARLVVVDAAGGARRPLTPGGEMKESRPSRSPDGTRLAFTRDPGKILTMDHDGSQVRQVPFERPANGVDWVPSG